MVDFKALGGFAQEMLSQVNQQQHGNNQHGGNQQGYSGNNSYGGNQQHQSNSGSESPVRPGSSNSNRNSYNNHQTDNYGGNNYGNNDNTSSSSNYSSGHNQSYYNNDSNQGNNNSYNSSNNNNYNNSNNSNNNSSCYNNNSSYNSNSSYNNSSNNDNNNSSTTGADDVRTAVSSNLMSLLGGNSQQKEGTGSRGLGTFLIGLTGAGNLDESKVNAAHEKAYNQGRADDLSNQDLGAAAGKEVFDLLFGGSGSSGSRDRSVGSGGDNELAADVTSLFGTAAKEQQGSPAGSTDRGIGSNLLSSLAGAAQGAQPQRQKGTFEKIVDLISREVAKVSTRQWMMVGLTADHEQEERRQPERRRRGRYADLYSAHDQEEDLRRELEQRWSTAVPGPHWQPH